MSSLQAASRRRMYLAFLLALAISAILLVPGRSAQALSGAEFKSGNIISDEVFFNSNTMTAIDIQNMIAWQERYCTASNGYPCLKDYSQATQSRAASPGRCAAYTGSGSESASTILYKVAQACGINPQVLLVTLEKEQGLVTSTAPTYGGYRSAMGYGCPDSGSCDAQYYGFFNQVYKAAWQFKEYGYEPDAWRYRIGNVAIQRSPNTSCGSSVVNIQNQATANLYNYTPYQPNAAALANLYGLGDGCSSYGNRNFWVVFNNWFGSPTQSSSPIGNVELLKGVPGGIQVAGWTLDPDTSASITAHVYVDGVATGFAATANRPDVGAAFPSNGSAHGFGGTIPLTSIGDHSVCIYWLNVGAGANTLYGCSTVWAGGGAPTGQLDAAVGSVRKISVRGWAVDPDTAAPISAHVYVDATPTALVASQSRPDVAAVMPGYGGAHGFAGDIAASAGTHTVCAYGINTGPGVNTQLTNCFTVSVPEPIVEHGRVPIGVVDGVSVSADGLRIRGWAIDPDTVNPITVHIYIDSTVTGVAAVESRNDIAAAFPGYGAAHGFDTTIKASPGAHRLCVYALNSGPGGNATLACETVSVPYPAGPVEQGRAPIGVVDEVSVAPTGIFVRGWAIDPDTYGSITVHVYVDGTPTGVSAVSERQDVEAAFPGYGPQHGYSVTVPTTAGTHSICVYGINAGPGANTLFGCSSIAK